MARFWSFSCLYTPLYSVSHPFGGLGAQFLSPHLPDGNPGEGGAGPNLLLQIPPRLLAFPGTQMSSLMNSPPPHHYLVPSISNPTSWTHCDTPVFLEGPSHSTSCFSESCGASFASISCVTHGSFLRGFSMAGIEYTWEVFLAKKSQPIIFMSECT